MVIYPVLTISVCTIVIVALLHKSARPPGDKYKQKHRAHDASSEKKDPLLLHPIPSVVQPNKRIVVTRRDATRLYLATPSYLDDNDDERQSEDSMKTNTTVMDYATTDFLCIATDPDAQKHVIEAIERYGVGSCGPRGFFGTLTPHVMVEREFTAFLNQPAILYPSAAVVIPSALPILCSKGDVLLVSEIHSLEIARAAALCGAKVITVRLPYINLRQVLVEEHTTPNLKDAMCKYLASAEIQKELREVRDKLEPVLMAAAAETKNTCWLVADTITKDGILCLPEILSICEANHVRIFLNEGFGLGVLGSEGRGVPEFWCDMGYATSHRHFDLVAGSLEHAFAGLGGICTGALHLVEQQRNMGLGYCFSASAPPGLCECIRYALRQISSILPALHGIVMAFHKMLISARIPFVGIPWFPIVFIQLPASETSAAIQEALLYHYNHNQFLVNIVDHKTICISITAKHMVNDLKKLVEYIEDIFQKYGESIAA